MNLLNRYIRNDYGQVLAQRNFRRIWLAGLISVFGDVLYDIGVLWFISQQTGSVFAVGAVVISGTLPALLFGLVGGVIADKLNRRKLMVGLDVLRAFLVVIIPLLYHFDSLVLPVVLVITFIRESLGFFFFPAQQATVPDTISEDLLPQANSLNYSSQVLISAAAPALAGVLIVVTGPISALYVDAVTFVCSAILLWRLDIKELHHGTDSQRLNIRTLLFDIGEGVRYIFHQPLLRILAITNLINIFGFGPYRPVALLYFQNSLGMNSNQYGLNLSIYFIGLSIGSAMAGFWTKKLGGGRLYAISHVLMGVITIFVGITPFIVIVYVLTALRALGNGLLSVSFVTLLQEQTPSEHRGRIFGTMGTISEAARPLSVAAGTLLAGLASPQLTIIISGVIFIVAALVAGIAIRSQSSSIETRVTSTSEL